MIPLDTIVAPATAPGRSALAIVRIDGPASSSMLAELTRSGIPPIRQATLVKLFSVVGSQLSASSRPGDQSQTTDNPRPGDQSQTTDNRQPTTTAGLIDECIAVRYEAPHSFTGNDLVELTVHGNPLLVERVVEACVALGARMALPGEFTERAVLNGKLDLVQAESIADLINARTALQAKLSLSNLEGTLSRKAAAIRQTLLEVISRLEAALDFSEEGYEFITRDEVRVRIEGALREIVAMGETYRRGAATRSGLSAVILGRPNAGKSTLLNRLVGSDRAIVTPIPGTTRDIVRETIEIGGLPVTIADTAGLRESTDVVEGIGIARAREAALTADVILYLVDATVGITEEDEAELAGLENVLLVYTKADLMTQSREDRAREPFSPPQRGEGARSAYEGSPSRRASGRLHRPLIRLRHLLPQRRGRRTLEGQFSQTPNVIPIVYSAATPAHSISAVSDTGMDELLRLLDERVQQQFAATEGALVNERQRASVAECEHALRSAMETAELDEQMILVDLYRASNALGVLTGAITRDEILAEIFGKFCIGK